MTLIEASISLVVVGLVVTTSLQLLASSVSNRAREETLRRGDGIARLLLAEILQLPYQDPDAATRTFGIETDENVSDRRTFDDIDDYDKFAETRLAYRDGTWIPDVTGWSRSVTVRLVSPAEPDRTVATDEGIREVRVTATGPDGNRTVLVALVSTDGTASHPPGAGGDFLTWIGVEISGREAGKETVMSATHLQNYVPSNRTGP